MKHNGREHKYPVPMKASTNNRKMVLASIELSEAKDGTAPTKPVHLMVCKKHARQLQDGMEQELWPLFRKIHFRQVKIDPKKKGIKTCQCCDGTFNIDK